MRIPKRQIQASLWKGRREDRGDLHRRLLNEHQLHKCNPGFIAMASAQFHTGDLRIRLPSRRWMWTRGQNRVHRTALPSFVSTLVNAWKEAQDHISNSRCFLYWNVAEDAGAPVERTRICRGHDLPEICKVGRVVLSSVFRCFVADRKWVLHPPTPMWLNRTWQCGRQC